MGYKIDEEVFEKITLKGIRNSSETMAFLKKEALEIFTEEREKWEGDQETDEDRNDPELWYEYLTQAEKKLEKYLYRWFDDIRYSVDVKAHLDKIPPEIVGIFTSWIEDICERIKFEEFASELLEDIFHEHTEKKKEVK